MIREYYARLNRKPNCASKLGEAIRNLYGYDYFSQHRDFVSPTPENSIFAVTSKNRRTRVVFKLTSPRITPEAEAERLKRGIKGLELIPIQDYQNGRKETRR